MRRPTIRQLQILQALARFRSVGEVAEQLYISQPSVSIQLKNLAELIGMPLYQMQGRNAELTDAGHAVLKSANQIFQTLDNMNTEIDNLRGLITGTLSLSVVTTAQYFLPILLAGFLKHYPQVDVKLEISNRETLFARMRENKDDFYLLGQPPNDLDVIKTPFLDNELVVVAPHRHELVKQSHISLARLSHYPFIMREEGSGTRVALEGFCQQHDIKLHQRMTIASSEAIKSAVAAGLGLAVMSRHSLDFGIMPGLTILNVEHFPITSSWYLVQRSSRQSSLLADAFLDFMKHHGKQVLAAAQTM